MSKVPKFASVDFADAGPAPTAAAAAPWMTPEGIPVKPSYGEADLAGIDFLDTYPGKAPFLRGPYPCLLYTSDAADE